MKTASSWKDLMEREIGGGVVADEGGIAKRFSIKFRDEAIFGLYTPFFVCLASGDLEPDVFLHCISQDVHFLKAFARAYELAEDCADDDDDRNAIRKLRKRVIQKLQAHDTLVREWGFESLGESICQNATNKYSDFLLATALGKVEGERGSGKIVTPFEKTKVAAYTFGAVAPCMRLGAFICNEIQALLDPDDSSHTYKRWIDHYCSEDFEAAALQTEDIVDKLSVSLTGEELEVIEKLYHQAMKLEVNFFASQSMSQPTIVPLSRVPDDISERHLTIFCDFDLTCTAFDSSAILAEIAILTAPKEDLNGYHDRQLARMSSGDLRKTWNVLSTQYTKEFEQCVESIISSDKVDKFDYKGLQNALEQLADFEKKENARVVQFAVLKGLNIEDIKNAGKRLILQDGCRRFFQRIVKDEIMKTDVHVLSYCWCGDLIRSAFSSGDLNGLNVHSNELAYEESVTNGEIVKKMESPMEKLQAFINILKDCNREGKHLKIYVGGSVGDLLCLLEADIGIVIGSSSSLRKLGNQFGVEFVSLLSGLVRKQRELSEGSCSDWKPLSGILYTVSSWAEIEACIFGV